MERFIIYIILVLFIFAVSFLVTILMGKSHKIKELEEVISQKNKSIENTFTNMEKLSEEKEMMHKDLRDLEDSLQTSHGIKIRNDIKNIIVPFSKIEMVFINAGIEQLLKNTKDPYDAEYYIKLMKKIHNILPDMKEEEIKEKESKNG